MIPGTHTNPVRLALWLAAADAFDALGWHRGWSWAIQHAACHERW